MKLVIALLVVWAVLALLGLLIKGLLWLLWVAIILFVATAIFGALRRRSGSGTRA